MDLLAPDVAKQFPWVTFYHGRHKQSGDYLRFTWNERESRLMQGIVRAYSISKTIRILNKDEIDIKDKRIREMDNVYSSTYYSFR